MGPLGAKLVLGALLSATAGLILGVTGALKNNAVAVTWSRRLAIAFACALIGAAGVMEIALLKPDFSVSYVAHVGSRSAPIWVRAVSLWSSLEGSILFWGAVLGVYILGGVRTLRQHAREEAWGLSVMHACGTFFALLVAGPANPFGDVSPVPADGPGPNPLLQNHLLMVVHPPMLYLGYVGMVVPFALASAALLSGRLGPGLLRSLRLWLIVPWLFLTVGIVLGGWWAYEVLGWGGYWGWDPVENAPLLPWLTATAAVHSALVAERRGILRGWTVSLVMVSYLLTILGTFMTRSGVFNSVHAFAQSDIGPTFLAFLGLCLVFTVLLLSARLSHMAGDGAIDQATSREGAVVFGNLVLVMIMVTVLLGTVFPLVTEAIRGVQISVGEPYFNRMTVPLGVALLFLMGIGPALPWGRVASGELVRSMLPSTIAGLVLLVAGFALGARDGWLLATLAGAGFTLEVTFVSVLRPIVQRVRHGRSLLAALGAELTIGRRQLGGALAHFGLVTVLVAVGVSHAAKLHTEVSLARGESAHLGRYEVQFLDTQVVDEPNRQSVVARMAVMENGSVIDLLQPRLNFYPTQREPVGTPSVRSGFREDLYLSAMSIDQDKGRVGLRIFVNPMVAWIWIGAGIIALGLVLTAWPRRAPVTVEAAEISVIQLGAVS